MTRSKIAALGSTTSALDAAIDLVSLKAAVPVASRPVPIRKRSALGDVSNVLKKQNENASSTRLTSKTTLTTTHVGAVKKPTTTSGNTTTTTTTSVTARTTKSREPLASKSDNAAVRPPPATRKRSSDRLSQSSTNLAVAVVSQTAQQSETNNNNNNNNNNASASAAVAAVTAPTQARKKPRVEEHVHDVPQDPVSWEVLDREDEDDPLMVASYSAQIFDYLYNAEELTMPNPNYMDKQTHLDWRMRGILVDWMIEVHAKFRLLPETLFLAVNIADRFLSLRIVDIDKLQLVGTTAMFIAAKFEEVVAPSIQNFIYVVDGGYSEDDILKAERYILKVLDFDLSYPNPMNFLRRNSKADDYDIQSRTVAKYLLEISLVDHTLLRFPPSQVAAAATFLARVMLGRGRWVRLDYLKREKYR